MLTTCLTSKENLIFLMTYDGISNLKPPSSSFSSLAEHGGQFNRGLYYQINHIRSFVCHVKLQATYICHNLY